ncbi:MAG: hypothetical protein ABI593_02560 [Betaproteobacteria bacterium]
MGALLALVLTVWLGLGASASFAQSTAVEFYNAALDHYFITSNSSEMADLDNGVHAGWARTGLWFPALAAGTGASHPGSNPVCRFYGNPAKGLDSHFYAADPNECSAVLIKFPDSWLLESEEVFRVMPLSAGGGCDAQFQPVFRLWNNRTDSNHRYTTSTTMFDAMVLMKYIPEGSGSGPRPVIFCVPVAGAAGVPDCTFSASTATPVVGTLLALTATCTGSPSTYVWTGCSSSQATCNAVAAVAGPATYSVKAANGAGTGATISLTVNWSAGSGGGKPVCAVNVDDAKPTVGTTATLSANCSQSPTAYRWLSCSYLPQEICNVLPGCAATSGTCKVSESNAGFVHYALDATNAAGTTRATRDVEWMPAYQPPAVPICSLQASDTSPMVNSFIGLSANCSGNPSSFVWTGCASNQATCIATSNVAGSITYGVAGTNAAGTGNAGNVTVTWMLPGPPVCNLSPSTSTPFVGQTITITATCGGNPTSYVWTGCNSSTATCQATATDVGTKLYTLIATNGAGAVTSSVSVTWIAPVITPVCTLTAAKNTATVGEQVTLTAACSNAPTSYAWTGCTSTGPTCTATSVSANSVTYSVSGKNVHGTGPAAATTINWMPVGSAGDYCGNYPIVIKRTIAWGDSSRMLTSGWDDNQGFRAAAVVVLAFTVPNAPNSYDVAGNSSVSEYQDPATSRHLTLSRSSCDFRGTDASGAFGPFATSFGNSALVAWNVGAAPVRLTPGETYYINIRNYSPDLGGNSCFRATCNAAIVTNWPKNN